MAKIVKAVDWIAENLNIYEQINRTDVSQNSVEHRWNPLGIQQEGTNINAEFLNTIQKNGVYGILETSHTVVNNEDRYIITNFDGIENIGVFKDLKVQIQVNVTNIWDNPKLVINNIEYSMVYSADTLFSNIKKNQLEANKIYNLTFNGVEFVVENSCLKATENSLGIISLTDIRKEVSSLSGAPYNGVFGTNLKNVISGKTYYYWDSSRNVYVTYMALKDMSNINGILTPDTLNFNNLSNLDLSRRGSRNIKIVDNGSWVDLAPQGGRWTGTYSYPLTLGYENILCARLTVETWTNAYVDSIQTLTVYKNDSLSFRYYDKNYDLINNAAFFTFGLDVYPNEMTVNFTSNNTTLPLKMRIRELKVFY